MIHINKTGPIPKVLTEKGLPLREKMEKEFGKGKTDFEFKSSVYGNDSVKDRLKEIQHRKCCFCEGKNGAHSYGDVEHFRPKGGYHKTGASNLTKPGYFWLAYEWDNLYYSCEICNRSRKKNLFPLTDEHQRAKSPSNPIEPEEFCLLIDPGKEDPAPHITFNHEIPVAKTAKGIESIKILGLDRELLNEVRRKVLDDHNTAVTFASFEIHELSPATKSKIMKRFKLTTDKQLEQKIKEWKAKAAYNLSPKGEFSHMLVCNS